MLLRDQTENGLPQILAQRRVLILDTCAAGAAMANLTLPRSDADVVKTNELFKDKTGFWVLAGSAADSVSYEAGEYSHGILTYALLLGMATSENDTVEVEPLFKFAKKAVEDIVRGNLGGVQVPQQYSMSTSFPLGLISKEDRARISPGEKRKRILRPQTLSEEAKHFDTLGLTKALHALLQDQNRSAARGAAGTWFVDADELPGALVPAGSYTVIGDKVTVVLILLDASLKDPVVATATIVGERTKPQELAGLLLNKINEIAARLK